MNLQVPFDSHASNQAVGLVSSFELQSCWIWESKRHIRSQFELGKHLIGFGRKLNKFRQISFFWSLTSRASFTEIQKYLTQIFPQGVDFIPSWNKNQQKRSHKKIKTESKKLPCFSSGQKFELHFPSDFPNNSHG